MSEDTGMTTVRGACPHDCPDTCALEIGVREGRVVSVHGAADHAHTRGVLCTKVSRYAERTNHPDRLLHPLRRVGPKGSGRFERVSWEAALDEIAARLAAIAAREPEAIVPYSYAGTMGQVQGEGMAARFWHKLGASRLDRTICSSAGGEALALTYGDKVGLPVQHFADSRLILIWGSNPITSNLHFWSIAQEAKRQGARLVAIDPRRSETAERCHEHLALRPGTDGALALALMHELIRLDALDADYLDRHTRGWPALRERALQWPPERAAAVCGLPVGQITALAQAWASTRPAAIRLNYGMQRVAGGGSAVRLIAALPCLTGAWRERGGGLLMSSSGWFNPHRDLAALHRPDLLAGRNPRTINMSTIGDDLLRAGGERLPDGRDFGPRIEALVVYNSNPVAVAPDSARVVRGFAREDLFTVVLEHFQTDTADYADFLLPATTQLEHFDVHTSYGHTDVLLNRPAIAPLGESRPNTWVFRELARRLGYTEPCFSDSDEALARSAFRGSVDFDTLAARGWVSLPVPDAPFANGGFPTADGRAQFDPPGVGVADHVPNHECADTDPALAARYPLAMISPPARHFLNSSFVNVTSLRAIEGEPVLEMHPDDAAARGIHPGQIVRVYNDRGATLCRAVVGAPARSSVRASAPGDEAAPAAPAPGRARPGVVNGLGIWWRKFGRDGTNVNELTHQRLTDLGRAPCFYDCLVEVEPAPESTLGPVASGQTAPAHPAP